MAREEKKILTRRTTSFPQGMAFRAAGHELARKYYDIVGLSRKKAPTSETSRDSLWLTLFGRLSAPHCRHGVRS
jgi:hypothetical protein